MTSPKHNNTSKNTKACIEDGVGHFLSASRSSIWTQVKGPLGQSEEIHLLAEPGGTKVCGEGSSHLQVQLHTQGLQL